MMNILIYKYFFLISFTKTKASIVASIVIAIKEYLLRTDKLQYLIPNENFHLHEETVYVHRISQHFEEIEILISVT